MLATCIFSGSGPPSIVDCEQSAEDFCKKNVSSLMQNPKTRLIRATKHSPLQVFTTVLGVGMGGLPAIGHQQTCHLLLPIILGFSYTLKIA